MSCFDFNDNLLFSSNALAATVADGGLSFLGVIFNAGEQIARVRIVSGNAALGGVDNPGGGVDLVVMDDFLFREPVIQVPEPSTWALVGVAGLALLVGRRRQRALSSRQLHFENAETPAASRRNDRVQMGPDNTSVCAVNEEAA